jgi:hypothetical protein
VADGSTALMTGPACAAQRSEKGGRRLGKLRPTTVTTHVLPMLRRSVTNPCLWLQKWLQWHPPTVSLQGACLLRVVGHAVRAAPVRDTTCALKTSLRCYLSRWSCRLSEGHCLVTGRHGGSQELGSTADYSTPSPPTKPDSSPLMRHTRSVCRHRLI